MLLLIATESWAPVAGMQGSRCRARWPVEHPQRPIHARRWQMPAYVCASFSAMPPKPPRAPSSGPGGQPAVPVLGKQLHRSRALQWGVGLCSAQVSGFSRQQSLPRAAARLPAPLLVSAAPCSARGVALHLRARQSRSEGWHAAAAAAARRACRRCAARPSLCLRSRTWRNRQRLWACCWAF